MPQGVPQVLGAGGRHARRQGEQRRVVRKAMEHQQRLQALLKRCEDRGVPAGLDVCAALDRSLEAYDILRIWWKK